MIGESVPKQPSLPEGYWYNPEGYLWFILPVDKLVALPETVEIDDQTLTKKSEFHVTVINARKVAREIARADSKAATDIEVRLQTLLTEYVREHLIEFVRFENDLRLAISPERTSIAARCTMQGVQEYFEKIQSLYGVMPSAQPTHVSIYTLTDGAVAIDTIEQMESFKKVELPDVQNILVSF